MILSLQLPNPSSLQVLQEISRGDYKASPADTWNRSYDQLQHPCDIGEIAGIVSA
jgi:hypothetical protein